MRYLEKFSIFMKIALEYHFFKLGCFNDIVCAAIHLFKYYSTEMLLIIATKTLQILIAFSVLYI